MFLSRRYRPNKWPFYVFLCVEGPLTVALLALFGIASPDLYRTRLWQDGSDNGFNSNPNAALYAAANYRPYTTPKVWSQFITNFNVVISVLSMFIMLAKSVMYIVHVFPPILSVIVHAILIALYCVSISYQAASDTSDPEHPQNGPPWYITKSCSVAFNKNNTGYCLQAKASFACTVAMTGVFFCYFAVALWSCFPSRAQRERYAEKQEKSRLRATAYSQIESPSYSRTPRSAFNLMTPGPPTASSTGAIKSPPLNPMTPRTLAFNKLGGTRDLPMRNHFSTPNAPKSPTYALQSPDFPRSPLSPGFSQAATRAEDDMANNNTNSGMYFPPPPKTQTKK